MLLLISSNAAPKYSDDIIRLLAQPRGAGVQFRYDLKYLHPALLARVRGAGLAGEAALVCFMLADADKATTTLTSCRAVTVRRSALVGSSCILTLTACDYVHPLDDAELRSLLQPAERKSLPTYSGSPAAIGGSFVLEVNATLHAGKAAKAGEEIKAFEETAASLAAFPTFRAASGIAFFAICALATDDQKKGWFGKRVRAVAGYADGRYLLQSGLRYELAVYTYRPAGSAIEAVSTRLVADSDEKAVRFTSNKEIVLDSRYDLSRFAFTTDQFLDPLPAGIRVALSIPSRAPPAPVQRCDITLQVLFAGRRREAWTRMFFLGAGTAWPAILGLAFKDQFGFWMGVAMCVGPAIAAYAATFPMLRKAG
jgi:hypothetical protein